MKPVHSYQDITITGLGGEGFSTYLEAYASIQECFQQFLPGRAVSAPESKHERAYPTLYFSNRFFTPISEAKGAVVVPFSKETDPLGLLRAVTDGLHTTDNVVRYYECIRNNAGLRQVKLLLHIIELVTDH